MHSELKITQPFLMSMTGNFHSSKVSATGVSDSITFSTEKGENTSLTFLPDCSPWLIHISCENSRTSCVIKAGADKKTLNFPSSAECTALRFLPGESLASELPPKGKNNLILFRQISAIIERKKGILKITELEKLSGYSARYLNYIFEKHTGMSAKQYSGIIKMQYIINELLVSEDYTFAKIAQKFGFYDQSHFVHEFKNFTGMKPSEFMNCIRSRSEEASRIAG